MLKGKFGLLLPVYAVIGFVLAVCEQTALCFALLFFVMAAENHVATSKQVAEAALLATFHTIVKWVLAGISSGLTSLLSIGHLLSGLTGIVSGVFGFLQFALMVVVLVFAVLAVINVFKGKPANVPGIHALVNRMFGENA